MTILPYDTARKKDSNSSARFNTEREACLRCFEKWNETDQVEFVENLLARMCHYQHGHINAYLKPMLQRDFISLLPSKFILFIFFSSKWLFSSHTLYKCIKEIILISSAVTLFICQDARRS